MKNFFLPKAGMPEEAQRNLTAFPEAVEFNLDGAFGWVVEEIQLKKVLKILGAEKTAEKNTSYDGIFLAVLNFNAEQSAEEVYSKKPEITVASGSNFRCDHWKNFSQKIQEWIGENLSVSTVLKFTSDGNYEMQKPEDKLFIEIGRNLPEKVGYFSEKIGKFTTQYLGGGKHLRISNLPSCPDEDGSSHLDNVFQIFQQLLPLVLETDQQKIAEMKRIFDEAETKANRQKYVDECHKRFEKTLSGTKDAIKQGHDRIAQLQQELVRAIRETQGKELKLEQLLSSNNGQLERYGLEFDRLLSVKKVLSIKISDGEVKVFTDTLFCVDPRNGKTHEIGNFEIRIPTNGSGGVRWFNLTRRVGGYKSDQNAPHIWSDGSACLGNTQEIFPELIGNYEFATVAMVAIQFVESVNTDDSAGKHIDKWPIAGKVAEN